MPPLPLVLDKGEAHDLLRQLFSMGVKPEALLLPKQTGQGRCKLCQVASLAALFEVLRDQCNGDLSQHVEVMRHC